MPINSSSIPALRAARAAKRRRRAEGGAVFPEDIKRVHIRSDAPAGADESAMAGRTSTVPSWGMTSAFGTLSPGEEAMSTQELGDSQSSNFISKAGSVIGGIAKGLFYDFPKNMIDRSVQNPQPGLRREDFTDIPPDTSPDPRSAFGGVGVDVPKVGWQPVDPMVGSSLEAAGNMAGVSAPFIQKNALGIFGGRLAQTADHAALARAEKMSLEGVAPEVIWKDTGWFKGADDKWRFEIDDSASGYKRIYGKGTIDNYPISTPHTVETGAAYQHPDLYAAYPDLEKVPLQFRDLDGARGQYSHNPSSPGDLIPPHEAISLQTPVDRYGANMKQARSTTLHELQHAVQTREGFVPGGSPAEMQELVRATSDARVLRGQMELGSSVEEAAAAFAKAAGRPPHPAATKIAQELPPEDLSRIADNPHEAYRRLSGEVEARNVQTRQDLPDVARANIFPRSTEDVLPDLQTLGRGRPGRATDMSEIDGLLGAERKLAGVSDGRPPTAAAGPAAAPDPAAMGPGGGGTAGVRSLPEAQAAAARWAGERAPLEGLPGPLKIGEDFFVPGPIGKIHDVAEDFMRTVHPDRPYTPPTKYHPIDPEHSQAIAKAYEEMKHTPSDPATKASYDALIDETAKQYDAIKKTGLKIEPVPAGSPDPYAANPRLAAVDVAENNHLWFFPTESGFGTVNKITDNPMLRKTGEKIGDHEMLANDMFRVVHDYFGHLKQGHGFRAAGEDNAWRTHAQMYSDLARPAMTTETRGQNSWVNYGPHGEKNRTASGADTIYADQKVGLMPEWTMRDRGSLPPIMVYHGSPHYFRRANISKIGTGEGNQAYGHGLYFAGHEPVSEWYRWQLATRQDPLLRKYKIEDVGHVIGAHLSDAGGDAAKLAHEYALLRDRLIAGGETDKATKNMIKDYDQRIRYLNDPERATGYMYQFGMDVPPEKLLDYDLPFSSQSQHVQGRVGPELEEGVKHQIESIRKTLDKGGRGDPASKYFRRMFPGERANLEGRLLMLEQTGATSFPGKEIYKRMGLPAKDETEGAVKASKRLLGMDIPGLRYADAGSRAPGQRGSHNYVMFGDNMLRLLRQYGVVGIPAAGVLAADGEERRARGGRVAMDVARKVRASKHRPKLA